MAKKDRKSVSQVKPGYEDLPAPPIPPDVDLRDVPPPIDLFIEMAMAQFGVSREEATKMVLEVQASTHGVKGNA